MFKKAVMVLIGSILVTSCASKVHRGVVAMKIDENTAHVGLNKDEVTVGDHVELYRNECVGGSKNSESRCEKVSKGHGAVTQILNENYVTVKFDSGVSFQEGDFIEKHSH